MSNNKKYFWLKLKEDFFEEDTIAWIEEQPNGKEYSLFYLKLCLKSLNTNGVLIRRVGRLLVPYDAKMLSKLTNTEFDTVLVALELFKQIGLITVQENGEIFLPQLENMVGSESKWAKYKRKNNKLENFQSNSKGAPKLLQTEIEKEIEKEIDIELDKEIDIELDKEIDIEIEKEKEKELNKFYKTVTDLYNDTCVSLPKVKSITAKRKETIKKLMSEEYTLDQIKEIFKKAEESPFLKGENNNNWNATFDWLLKEENAVKVLEGNYDRKIKKVARVETIDNPFLRAAVEMGGN